MAYPTTTEHHKNYPFTSIMASPYSGDPTGVVDCTAGIEAIKANQSNIGTIFIPRGTFLIATNLTIPSGMTLEFAAGASFSISAGVTLTLPGTIIAPDGQICFSGAGVLSLGTTFPTADTTKILQPGTWSVTANTTIPSNVVLRPRNGAILSVATGVTLTINGALEAGPYQIFSCTGTGAVALANKVILADWFGVSPDATAANNATYLTAAMASVGQNCTVIFGKAKEYPLDPVTIATYGLILTGQGRFGGGTKLTYASGTDSLFTVNANACSIKNLYLYGPGAAPGNGDIAINIADNKWQGKYTGLYIQNFDIGIKDDGYQNNISDTQIYNFGTYGINYVNCSSAFINNSTLSNDVAGSTKAIYVTTSVADLHIYNSVIGTCDYGVDFRGIILDISGCHFEGPVSYDVFTNASTNIVKVSGSRLAGILRAASSSGKGSRFELSNNYFTAPSITDNAGSKWFMTNNNGLNPSHFSTGLGQQYWLSDEAFETSVTWDPANLTSATGETNSSITLGGASLGDLILFANGADLQDCLAWAWVQAANTINARVYNGTAGAVDIASASWKFYLIPKNKSRYSATFNPADIATSAVSATDFAVPGVVLGDFAFASFSLDTQGLFLSAAVTAADTVTVTIFNGTGGNINLASGTIYIYTIPANRARQTSVWDPADLVDTTGETKTFSAPGIVTGYYAMVAPGVDVTDLVFSASYRSASTVEVRLQNETGGNVNLGSSSWAIIALSSDEIRGMFP